MPSELRAKSVPMGQKSSTWGTGWLLVLAFVSIFATFFLSALLALSLDEYWGYIAAFQENGERQAAMNADEELFGVGFASFLLVVLWLAVTGTAFAIAIGTGLPVLRTTVTASIVFVVIAGVFLCAWLLFAV